MKVDIELIKQRKSQYGSNFEAIKIKWEKFFKEDLEDTTYLHDDSVARMMALMKEARIEAIIEKLEGCGITDYEELLDSLVDSQKDRGNYLWIANNYEEYLKL